MPPKGSVLCFMCRTVIRSEAGDLSKYRKHMKITHQIKFGLDDYILAGCYMTLEERLAVKDVVMDKMSGNEENVPPDQERYKCDKCPISFSMPENLSEHLERKHKIFKTEALSIELDNEVSPVFIDTGAVDIKSELSGKHHTKKAPPMKKSKINQKKKAKRSSLGGAETPVLAGPNMDAGDGNICRLCSKEFPGGNGPMRRHFEDIHNPGVYPCKGCGKIFTSKNKVSSHYSRNCKRKTL